MKNNKKGFTLLEVLGVIVVLAFIALITIPMVTNIIKDSKRSSFITSMTNLVKSADNYYSDNQLSIDSVMTFCYGSTRGSNCTSEKLKHSGLEPKQGKLIVNPDGEISLVNMSNGAYYANYNSASDDDIVITDTDDVLTRDELTQAVKDLQEDNKKIKEELASTTDIANEANNKANNLNNNMLNKTYPVGSIYMSYSSANPSSAFGGTWVTYGTGRSLTGVDTGNSNYNTVGKTGGSSSITLNTANLPSHNHSVVATGYVSSSFTGRAVNTSTNGDHSHITSYYYPAISTGATYGHTLGGNWVFGDLSSTMSTNGNHAHSVTAAGNVSSSFSGNQVYTSSVGGGSSINIQNPYITVYMWRRTA